MQNIKLPTGRLHEINFQFYFCIINEELNDLYSSQYCLGDKIEKNEMGGACSMYEGEERGIEGFGGETLGKETTWETQV